MQSIYYHRLSSARRMCFLLSLCPLQENAQYISIIMLNIHMLNIIIDVSLHFICTFHLIFCHFVHFHLTFCISNVILFIIILHIQFSLSFWVEGLVILSSIIQIIFHIEANLIVYLDLLPKSKIVYCSRAQRPDRRLLYNNNLHRKRKFSSTLDCI